MVTGDLDLDEDEEFVTCTQTITIVDNFPESTIPEDTTPECPADFTTDANGVATATDDCEMLSATSTDEDVPTCGTTKTVLRTWSVTDKCNDPVTAVQTITELDRLPPVITCPDNGSFDCASNLGVLPSINDAVDACQGAITPVYNGCCFSGTAGTDLTLDRTWTATDACNNEASNNEASCTQENPLSPTCPTLLPPS